ncbi:MAG: hypothetical protein S0880_34540 [Actinomycetota bacterium]|nr:hypothetical protein [Actinomycetota bacterium]
MAEAVVSITLTPGQLARIGELVTGGEADSVPDFVARAVGRALEEQAPTDLDGALAATGGELTPEERDWADEVLRSMTERVRGFVGARDDAA